MSRNDRQEGRACANCSHPLGDDAVLWQSRAPMFDGATRLVCSDCAQQVFRCGSWGTWMTTHCQSCGREIHRQTDRRLTRRFEVCSARCRDRAVAAARKERRQVVMQRTCSVCGSSFTGRRDASACSSACRQKAYRQRQALQAAEHPVSSNIDGSQPGAPSCVRAEQE